MSHLGEWNIVCAECGIVHAYDETTPTECPNNPVHQIGEVTKIGEVPDEIILHSPNKLWSIAVDDDGLLVIQEIV